MSKVIKGIVTWVSDEKKYDNYGFKLKGHDQFFNSPNRVKGVLEKGYEVKVVVEENERGNYDVKKKPELIAKGTLPSRGGRGGYGGGGRFKQDPEKARNIAAQHSQDVGLATAALLLAQGAVKLPAKKPDAIKTVILELIDEQTAKAFAQVFKPELFTSKSEEIEEDLSDDAEEETEEQEEEPETEETDTEEKDSGEIEDDVPWDND